MGYILTTKGVDIDPVKIEAVKEWEQPHNVLDIWSFLGFTGYYRHFIENFSKIAKPMTNLLKKTNEFEWTPECK